MMTAMNELLIRKRDAIEAFVETFQASKKLLLEIRNQINEFSLLIDGRSAEFVNFAEETVREDKIISELLAIASNPNTIIAESANVVGEAQSSNGPKSRKKPIRQNAGGAVASYSSMNSNTIIVESESKANVVGSTPRKKPARKKRKAARYRFCPKRRRRGSRKVPVSFVANLNVNSLSDESEYKSPVELSCACKIEQPEETLQSEYEYNRTVVSGSFVVKPEPGYDESEYESMPVVMETKRAKRAPAVQSSLRPYKRCTVCNQYVRDKNLMKHKATLHSANLNVECPVCGAALRKASFAFHMRRQHNDMRYLTCTVCGKVCSFYWILIHMYKEHEMTATDALD